MLKKGILCLGMLLLTLSLGRAETAGPPTTSQTAKELNPQAIEILRNMFKLYQNVHSYQDEVTLTVGMGGNAKDEEAKPQSFHSQLAFERPNKIYFVWPSVNLVCDGKQCQVYYPKCQQYMKQPAPAVLTRSYLEKMLMENLMTMVLNGLVSEKAYEDAIQNIDHLEYLGTDRIKGRVCQKLRFVEKSSRVTMFIDQERGTICELLISPTDPSDKWDLTVTYQKVDVNKPVDAGKFKITKPEGARLVDRISFTRQFDYPRNGNRIPDFDIGVLGSDRKASVKSFLGKKITFVTFWATWCPPCRAELPILEELYKQYQGQGFEVVGINLDTDSDLQTIKKSADELGITFPVLLDSRARYARELLVQNIPTLLILNSEGKIMEAHVGTSPDVRKELSGIIENAISKSPAASQPEKK